MYGNSEIKRKNHEKSEKHTLALASAKAGIEVGSADGRGGDNMDEEEAAASDQAQSSQTDDSEDNDDDNWSEIQKLGKGYVA